MDKEILGNRYEVLEKLGEGGMAVVYKARCTLLNRIVAIKVLRPQFAADEDFVERFRREAQAAASLSHPNVVGIYDVGQEGNRYYIVMEYVKGRSLRDIMRESGPLPPKEAAWIASQILLALDHAHRNGIVHRDIKPHNILLTEDGRVKVADFGIARALNTATMTETGTVVGTVNYFSPEQARGSSVGPQSDLYSLGVVLYEMLTGELPFKGDSPIAVALKHIQEEPPKPRSVRPEIPVGLERVVMKALDKDTSRRYKTAGEMLGELEQYARGGEPVPGEELPTRVIPRVEAQETREAELDDTLVKEARPRGGWMRGLLLVLSVFFAVAAITGFIVVKLPEWLYVAEVQTPDFVGKDLEEARLLALEAKLTLDDSERRYDSTVERNHIISQSPPPYQKVKANSKVYVVVSLGKEKAVVPDLIGKSEREVKLALESAKLALGTRSEGYSSSIKQGLVISQVPQAGREVEAGTPVDIVVSKGPEPPIVTVPDFTGRRVSDVTPELAGLLLSRGEVTDGQGNARDDGIVVEQYPRAGALVEKGTKVDFIVQDLSGVTVGTGEGVDAAPTRVTVDIDVPPGPDAQEVKIVVNDFYGEHTAYKGMHKPLDHISREIVAYGARARLRVYIDGVLYKDETIRRD